MYTSLNFLPANLQGPATDRPLLSAAGSISTALAAIALRSYHLITKELETPPGSAGGKIQVDKHLAIRLNNVAFDEPIDCAVMQAYISDLNREAWLQIFADRTCLVMIEDHERRGRGYSDVMTVLPIVLKLPSQVWVKQIQTAATLRVTEHEGQLDLRASYTYFGDKKEGSLLDDYTNDLTLTCLKTEVGRAIHAWAKSIANLPWVADPGTGPTQGILGKSIPAPCPEANGKPYVWPAVMPYTNFTPEQYEQASAYFALAYAHVKDSVSDRVKNAHISIIAAERQQSAARAKIKIEAQAICPLGRREPLLASLVESELSALLRHKAAPRFITKMTSNTLVPTSEGSKRVKLQCHALFVAIFSKNEPSAHDRLKAIGLFGG
jgi:hypothetical protein